MLYRGTELRRSCQVEQWREFRRERPGDLQDPFGVYNSFYKVDHVLTTPLRKFKLASSRDEERRMIEQALRAVGLRPEDTLGRYPHQLSGGQRQRTMVARTLLLRPRVIVADEPVSMIDASLRATVLGNLLQLKRRVRHLADLHHARPDDGVSDQRSDHGAVSRQRRRSKASRSRSSITPARLHAGS